MVQIRLCLFFFTLFSPLLVWAIDLQPNDIVAPPPGKNLITVSYLNAENSTLYKNGTVASKGLFANPVIETHTAVLRLTTTYALGDLPGASFIQLPYGKVSPTGSLAPISSDSGIGDLTIASAIWPYADHVNRTYVGLAGYFFSPTGSHSNQRILNISENRYRADLQMGFQTPITKDVDGMVAVDTMWFGGNSQCGAACGLTYNGSLTQKPLTTTQLGPIYRINNIFTVAASYFYVAGGATAINNNYQNNVVNTQRFLLSSQAYTPIGRFSLQYGRDMEIKNGFIQTRLLILRFMKEI